MSQTYLTATDGFKIAYHYAPVDNPKGLVQLVHGSLEYKERYQELIHYLNKHSFACIISDNRGHGHSVSRDFPYGHMDSPEQVLSDLRVVTDFIKAKHPNLPLAMIGHSMGSLLARNYLMANDDQLDLLILTGTVAPVKLVPIAIALSKIMMPRTGGTRGFSRLVAVFNKIDADPGSWLAYHKEHLEHTKLEHLLHFRFDNGAHYTTYQLVRGLLQVKSYACQNPQLPIYSLSGQDDPITEGKKGLELTKKALNTIGYSHVTITEYDQMMHEIFFEAEKDKVFRDILHLLNKHCQLSPLPH